MAKLNLKVRATVSCSMEVEMISREATSEPKVNALTRPSLLDCLRATDYMQMLLMLHYYVLTLL